MAEFFRGFLEEIISSSKQKLYSADILIHPSTDFSVQKFWKLRKSMESFMADKRRPNKPLKKKSLQLVEF